MNRRRLIILIILLLLGIYLYSHRLTLFSSKKPNNRVPVSVATVVKKDVVVSLQAIGQVEPLNTVSVTSQVDGQIIQVGFQAGETLKQGQLLFQIDPRPYSAKLAQAKATLLHDQAQLWSVQLLLKRYQPLLKKGYVSKQDYDTAKSNTEALQANIQADQAAIEQAALDLDDCTITSPISGRSGDILVNAGNIVTAANKTPLVVINQIQPIYVSFTLPENQLPILQQAFLHHPVAVIIALHHQQKEQGTLTFINNTVDNTTGTILLKAEFKNNDQQLWPGQFVQVSVPTTNISQALIVPDMAIQQGQNGAYVYVLKPNKTVAYQPVTIGATVPEGTIIIKGLVAGEQVITAGQLRLDNGTPVTVQQNP